MNSSEKNIKKLRILEKYRFQSSIESLDKMWMYV